jgi:uncharacterized protein YbjQ (UPF0145 family)
LDPALRVQRAHGHGDQAPLWETAAIRTDRRSPLVLVTTTPSVEGRSIIQYHGLVSGEAIMGANVFKDVFAGLRDIVGGRSAAYERELRRAKDIALQEMEQQAAELGADAVVSVDLDYETVGNGSMLMVSASGTAVRLG